MSPKWLSLHAEQPEALGVRTDSVTDWGFCYNAEPGVWVSTQLAWYVTCQTSPAIVNE